MVPALGFTQCVLCCDFECVYYMLRGGYVCVWLFLKKKNRGAKEIQAYPDSLALLVSVVRKETG